MDHRMGSIIASTSIEQAPWVCMVCSCGWKTDQETVSDAYEAYKLHTLQTANIAPALASHGVTRYGQVRLASPAR